MTTQDQDLRTALKGVDVRAEADAYEFRADEGDHTPTEHERAMLEDFGNGLMVRIDEEIAGSRAAPPRPVDAERVVVAEMTDEAALRNAFADGVRSAVDASMKATGANRQQDFLRSAAARLSPAHSPDKAVTRKGVSAILAKYRPAIETAGDVVALSFDMSWHAREFAEAAAIAHQPTGTEARRFVIPANWKLVPKEPTEEMQAAGSNAVRAVTLSTSLLIGGMRIPKHVADHLAAEAIKAAFAATPTPPLSPEPKRMAEGCCSSVSPCSHQQRDPYLICDICTKAAGLTDKILSPDSTGPAGDTWLVDFLREAFDEGANAASTFDRRPKEKRWSDFANEAFNAFWLEEQDRLAALTPSAPIAASVREAWRPMETHPRDEKPVRIMTKDGRVLAAYWSRHPKATGGSERYPWVTLDETNETNGLTDRVVAGWLPLTPASDVPGEAQTQEVGR